MTINQRTITLFKETRAKLTELFKTNISGLQTDGHYSKPTIVDDVKCVMIENKHGETLCVPEEHYNRMLETIMPKNGHLKTLDGTRLKEFSVENQLWLGDVAYTLRDYTT